MGNDEHRERPQEKDAVRTTIVGGRPPGSGKDVGPIPRGIEVLVKKASVDGEFKALLLEKRAEAARTIELDLEPAEAAMLDAVPAAQLEAIIANTQVSPMTRAAFLGRAASVMVAALGAGAVLAPDDLEAGTLGIRPYRFVVYREENYLGEVAYRVADRRAFAAIVAKAQRANRALRQAYEAAKRAWAQSPQHRGVPFPMKEPTPVSCRACGRAGNKAEAEAQAQKLQEQLKAAEDLFEKTLGRLISATRPVRGIRPEPPPVTKGIRPERMPATDGIRPD